MDLSATTMHLEQLHLLKTPEAKQKEPLAGEKTKYSRWPLRPKTKPLSKGQTPWICSRNKQVPKRTFGCAKKDQNKLPITQTYSNTKPTKNPNKASKIPKKQFCCAKDIKNKLHTYTQSENLKISKFPSQQTRFFQVSKRYPPASHAASVSSAPCLRSLRSPSWGTWWFSSWHVPTKVSSLGCWTWRFFST